MQTVTGHFLMIKGACRSDVAAKKDMASQIEMVAKQRQETQWFHKEEKKHWNIFQCIKGTIGVQVRLNCFLHGFCVTTLKCYGVVIF